MKLNIQDTCKELKRGFKHAIKKIPGSNAKGTNLYKYQVEFCYLIDSIQRGPVCMIPDNIAKCNDLIMSICVKEHNYS